MIQARTLQNDKAFKSVVSKVCGQLITKLGGALWATPTDLKFTMVIGIEVIRNKESGDLVGALVASLDDPFTYFYSKAFIAKDQAGVSGFLMAYAYGLLPNC
jgi:hypothetical protein